MTTNRQEPGEMRAGVSVSEMARLVGLSRQRFRQLVQAGVFPQPKRDEGQRATLLRRAGAAAVP